MKQVTNLHDVEVLVALPGIKLNTSPTNYHPFKAMQLVKWDGKTWAPFGDIIWGVANPPGGCRRVPPPPLSWSPRAHSP